MKKTDFEAFNSAVTLNHKVRGRNPDPEVTAIWFELLVKYDLSDIQRALKHQALHGRYPAQPHDVAKFVDGLDDRGDANPRPPEATKSAKAMPPQCTFQIAMRRCPDAIGGAGKDIGFCDGHATRLDDRHPLHATSTSTSPPGRHPWANASARNSCSRSTAASGCCTSSGRKRSTGATEIPELPRNACRLSNFRSKKRNFRRRFAAAVR